MAQQTVIPDSVDWLGGPDQHPYLVVDVFTSRALEGNQLGVFLDGRPFSSEQMQQLAREMSFAETVFLLPPRSEADVWVRIFTPSGELPFAGHPVLGTAFVVGTALGSGSVVLETGAGSVPVALDRADGQIVFGRMQQPIPEWEPFEQEAELLSALGVQQSTLPVELYRIGPTHVYVGLSSDEAVASLRIDLARLTDLGVAANCFAGHGRCWKTRMFCPAAGVPEDAATRAHGLGRWADGGPRGAPRPDRVRPRDRDPPGRGDKPAIPALRKGQRHRRSDRIGGGGRGRADRRLRALSTQRRLRPTGHHHCGEFSGSRNQEMSRAATRLPLPVRADGAGADLWLAI
jgi:trans-2,3-dihydro-3-hydroxyanthranilate isomerase